MNFFYRCGACLKSIGIAHVFECLAIADRDLLLVWRVCMADLIEVSWLNNISFAANILASLLKFQERKKKDNLKKEIFMNGRWDKVSFRGTNIVPAGVLFVGMRG